MKPGECLGDNVDQGSGQEQYGLFRRRVQEGHYREPDQGERERTVEQKVNVPVPEILEKTVEVLKPWTR